MLMDLAVESDKEIQNFICTTYLSGDYNHWNAIGSGL